MSTNPKSPKSIESGENIDPEYCPLSERVDGKKHSWHWDGDDPNLICYYCGEVRRSGQVIIQGRGKPTPKFPQSQEEKLACPKHSRILIGKSKCVDCETEKVYLAGKKEGYRLAVEEIKNFIMETGTFDKTLYRDVVKYSEVKRFLDSLTKEIEG